MTALRDEHLGQQAREPISLVLQERMLAERDGVGQVN